MLKVRMLSLAVATILLTACKVEIGPGGKTELFNYEFAQGAQSWQAGFSDYPSDNAAVYELDSGIKTLPAGFSGSGYLLSGHNRSDDLFMFLKRKVYGLSPSTQYTATVKVSLLSNAGEGCIGAGGAPGEAVYLKVGYADKEPKQEGYYLNVPKGNQSQDGTQAKVLGNVAIAGANCAGTVYKAKTLSSTAEQSLTLTTASDGSVWIFVGTDSGYEGKTQLYYQQIELRFTPK